MHIVLCLHFQDACYQFLIAHITLAELCRTPKQTQKNGKFE